MTDTFDFTEWRDPFAQDSLIEGILWFANDWAYMDTERGKLYPVDVRINVVIPLYP